MGGCSATASACTKAAPLTSGVQVICRQGMSLDACLDDGQDLADSHAMVNHRLLSASREADLEIIRVCIQNGANLETRRPFAMSQEAAIVGLTPLMYTAQGGSTSACEILLHARACVNAKDEDATSPLHFAASAGSRATCLLLLTHRADPWASDLAGRNAYDVLPMSELLTGLDKKFWTHLLKPEVDIGCQNIAATSGRNAKAKLHAEASGMARRPPPEPHAYDGDPRSRWKPSMAASRTTTDSEAEALVVVSCDEGLSTPRLGIERRPFCSQGGPDGSFLEAPQAAGCKGPVALTLLEGEGL